MPGQAQPREVQVRLGARSYSVLVGDGLLATLGAQSRRLFSRPTRAFVVADENLPAATVALAQDALRSAGWRVELANVTAREEMKSLATVERLLTHMAAARLERGEPVIALGGGLTGDVAGFAAAVYRRGVPLLQCPTSLLAMVDASVGGKVGVNLEVPLPSRSGLGSASGTQPSPAPQSRRGGGTGKLGGVSGTQPPPAPQSRRGGGTGKLGSVSGTQPPPAPQSRRGGGTGGGGTGLRKNMVGAFHQPSVVLCDVAVLDSLADEELACGLAECVKHALMGAAWGDAGLLEWMTANGGKFLARERGALVELVARNVTIKARVVEGDEREERTDGKGRMCLNMGHTVGHAIETMEVHAVVRGSVRESAGLKHGEAVALGLIAEAVCGEKAGVTRAGLAQELGRLLQELGLPTHVSGMPVFEAVRAAMQDDKKVGGGVLRLAVPTGQGDCQVITDPVPEALRAGLAAIGR